MTIYLACDGKLTGPNDDSWWAWMAREFDAEQGHPEFAEKDDIIIRNSILGPAQTQGGHHIGVFWELHPEMIARKVPSPMSSGNYVRMTSCAERSELCVTHTQTTLEHFPDQAGKFIHVPLGIDFEVFKPIGLPEYDVGRFREVYSIDPSKRLVLWIGTPHAMKGFELALERMKKVKERCHLIAVWKKEKFVPSDTHEGVTNFGPRDQTALNWLMNICDTFWSTNRLRPWYLVEMEAMVAGMRVEDMIGLTRDFHAGANPRMYMHQGGHSRVAVKCAWESLFERVRNGEFAGSG